MILNNELNQAIYLITNYIQKIKAVNNLIWFFTAQIFNQKVALKTGFNLQY